MSDVNDAFKLLSEQYRELFEERLAEICREPADDVPPRLHEAMAYSLMAGGKRLRPMLCLAAAERGGVNPEKALPMALALEFIHTATLIHDDLPCVDGDDLRRGKPTNHMVFGEALAIWSGDALVNWAFCYSLSRLAKSGIPAERVLRAVEMLAEAAGPFGVCGGQVLDFDPESRREDREFVYEIARLKTAALIRAAVVSGAILGEIDEFDLKCYYDYGTHLGIAFQIVDDILDVTSTREAMGKTPHKDEFQDKRTFVGAYGLEVAKELAREESVKAARALETLFPEGDLLIDLAKSLAERTS